MAAAFPLVRDLMTGSLRPTARNPIAVGLMGVLTLAFLIIGVSGGGGKLNAFKGVDANAVVVAGSHTVTQRDYKRAFDRQKEEIDQRQGQPVPLALLVESGLDQQLMSSLATQQSALEMLERMGIKPSDALVDTIIKRQPVFQNPVTGAFDAAKFQETLGQQGLTPREATSLIRDGIAEQHVSTALGYGFRAPRLFTAVSAVQGYENRDVSYFIMDPHAVPAPTPPTDAQLLAFEKAHAAELTIPEMRVFTLVRFSTKELQASVVIDPAAVQKEFAFKKDSLSKPETRSVAQIPVKTAAQGQQVAARLAKGEDPSAVAASLGIQPVLYADKPRSAIVDAKVGAAAFGMTAGQVNTVQGDLSLDVIKVSKITPGQEATLESARPQIEQALRERGARDKVAEMTEKFEDARDGGASITDAAQKAGATAVSIGPVTAQGQDVDGKPNPALSEKILKSAFAEAVGGQGTDIQTADQGESFALRVDHINPPSLPPLDQKRPQLTQAYLRETLINALKAKANTLMTQLRGGASMETVAAQVHGHVTHQVGLQRLQARQYVQTLGQEFIAGIFSVKPGEVFDAGGPGGIFIAKLDAIRPGNTTQMAQAVQTVAPRLSQDYLSDVQLALQTGAEHVVKPHTNIAAARTAINVDQETLDKLNAKPGAKPGASPAKPAS
jgi:peptidyl-prolyl cis-trans isomerase D